MIRASTVCSATLPRKPFKSTAPALSLDGIICLVYNKFFINVILMSYFLTNFFL